MNLTDHEFELLKSLPMLAGAVVAGLDSDGVVEAAREFFASAKVVSEGQLRYPDNPLIKQIHGELHDLENYKDRPKDRNQQRTSSTAVAMEAFVEVLDQALEVLDRGADPNHALEYKEWVMACAQAAAEAAKEGSFLGIGGKRISDREAAYLSHLRNRLGL